jgi:Holliday junction resolvase-like predicted endonuclease
VLGVIEVKAPDLEAEATEAVGARQRDRIIPAWALYLNARPGLRHKGIRFDAILVLPRRLPASRQRRVAAGIQIVKFVMRWPKERCT